MPRDWLVSPPALEPQPHTVLPTTAAPWPPHQAINTKMNCHPRNTQIPARPTLKLTLFLFIFVVFNFKF